LAIEEPIASESLGPNKRTRRIERELLALEFEETCGLADSNRKNKRKMEAALKPYLIEESSMKRITGGHIRCSSFCRGEQEN